jgi:hypothetical protein
MSLLSAPWIRMLWRRCACASNAVKLVHSPVHSTHQ